MGKDSLGQGIGVPGGAELPRWPSGKTPGAARNAADPLAAWKQDASTAVSGGEIKDAVADAANLVSRTDELRFLDDRILQRASASIAIQIGEAASKLNDEFRSIYPTVPWRAVIAMRHKLAHHYVDADPHVLWATLTKSLPELAAKLDLRAW